MTVFVNEAFIFTTIHSTEHYLFRIYHLISWNDVPRMSHRVPAQKNLPFCGDMLNVLACTSGSSSEDPSRPVYGLGLGGGGRSKASNLVPFRFAWIH